MITAATCLGIFLVLVAGALAIFFAIDPETRKADQLDEDRRKDL